MSSIRLVRGRISQRQSHYVKYWLKEAPLKALVRCTGLYRADNLGEMTKTIKVQYLLGSRITSYNVCYTKLLRGKHSGRKQYERWKYYNSTRLDENGRLINTSKTKWDEFYAPSKSVTGEKAAYNFNGNWESTQKTAFNHWSNGYSGGMGRVNCIAFDPANNNIIYVGTPGGGLWRSTDGRNNFV